MNYAIIDKATGQLLKTFWGDPAQLQANISTCAEALEGNPQGDWWDGEGWQKKPARPSKYHTFNWTKHAWEDTRSDAQKAADEAAELSAAKASKVRDLTKAMSASLEKFKSGYPEDERASWQQQADECKAWFAASSPSADLVPWCAACASARGIELKDFMDKVKAHVEAYSKASAEAVGKRKKLVEEVQAAETIEAVNAISWS